MRDSEKMIIYRAIVANLKRSEVHVELYNHGSDDLIALLFGTGSNNFFGQLEDDSLIVRRSNTDAAFGSDSMRTFALSDPNVFEAILDYLQSFPTLQQ